MIVLHTLPAVFKLHQFDTMLAADRLCVFVPLVEGWNEALSFTSKAVADKDAHFLNLSSQQSVVYMDQAVRGQNYSAVNVLWHTQFINLIEQAMVRVGIEYPREDSLSADWTRFL